MEPGWSVWDGGAGVTGLALVSLAAVTNEAAAAPAGLAAPAPSPRAARGSRSVCAFGLLILGRVTRCRLPPCSPERPPDLGAPGGAERSPVKPVQPWLPKSALNTPRGCSYPPAALAPGSGPPAPRREGDGDTPAVTPRPRPPSDPTGTAPAAAAPGCSEPSRVRRSIGAVSGQRGGAGGAGRARAGGVAGLSRPAGQDGWHLSCHTAAAAAQRLLGLWAGSEQVPGPRGGRGVNTAGGPVPSSCWLRGARGCRWDLSGCAGGSLLRAGAASVPAAPGERGEPRAAPQRRCAWHGGAFGGRGWRSRLFTCNRIKADGKTGRAEGNSGAGHVLGAAEQTSARL